jgi:hypothetical protein
MNSQFFIEETSNSDMFGFYLDSFEIHIGLSPSLKLFFKN